MVFRDIWCLPRNQKIVIGRSNPYQFNKNIIEANDITITVEDEDVNTPVENSEGEHYLLSYRCCSAIYL